MINIIKINNSSELPTEKIDNNLYFCISTGEFYLDYLNPKTSIIERKNITTEEILEQNKQSLQKIWKGTKTEFDALPRKDNNTIYIFLNEDGTPIDTFNKNEVYYGSNPPEDPDITIWLDPSQESSQIPLASDTIPGVVKAHLTKEIDPIPVKIQESGMLAVNAEDILQAISKWSPGGVY